MGRCQSRPLLPHLEFPSRRGRAPPVAPEAVSRAITTLPQAIVLTDRNGTILWTNGGVRTLFGTDPATCVGDGIERWMPGSIAKGHAARMAQYLRTRKGNIVGTQGRRVEAVHDDGSPIHVMLTVQVDERGPEPLFVATMTDLGRHDTQSALAARVARLEAEKAAREEVLAFVTHEVRNALAPVRIAVDNLLADVPGAAGQLSFAPGGTAPAEGRPASHDAAQQRNAPLTADSAALSGRPRSLSTVEADSATLRLLGHSTDAALEILNGILDIERLRRGKSLLADWFSLDEMLEHVQKTAALVGGEAGVSVCEDSGEDVRALEVFAAESKLAQCLTNFVTNAIKFTPDGGTVTIYASVEESTPGAALRPAAPMAGDRRPAGQVAELEGWAGRTPPRPAAVAVSGTGQCSCPGRSSPKKASRTVGGPPSFAGARPPPLALGTPTSAVGSPTATANAYRSINTGCTDSGPPGGLSLETFTGVRSSAPDSGIDRELQSSKGSDGPSSVRRTPYRHISSLTDEEGAATPAAQTGTPTLHVGTPGARAMPLSSTAEVDNEDEDEGDAGSSAAGSAEEKGEEGEKEWRSRRSSGGRSNAGPPSSASTSTTAREYTDGSRSCAVPPVPQLSEAMEVGGGEGSDGEFSAYGLRNGPPETPMTWAPTGDGAGEGDGDEHQQWLRLGVRDTGAGVPPEQRDRLFTVFEQLPNRKTRKGVGTGLGLAFVREVVERGHGGRVGLESEGAGKGADFFILIPLRHTRVEGSDEGSGVNGSDDGAGPWRLRGDATGRRSCPTPPPKPPQGIEEGETVPGREGDEEDEEEGDEAESRAQSTPPARRPSEAPGQAGGAVRPPTLSMTDTSSLRQDQEPPTAPGPERTGHSQTPQPGGVAAPGMQRLTMRGATHEKRLAGRRRADGSFSARSGPRCLLDTPLGEQSPTQSVGRRSALGRTSNASRSTRASRRSEDLPFLPKVLVVDDSGIVAKLLARRLSAWGAVARTASSGEKALALLRSAEAEGAPFHCLVTDLNMPEAEVQGHELARRAATLWPTLAIVITSGDDQATAPGAHARLVKPVSAIRLFSTIRRHVGRLQRRSE